ncbi:MAG: hypothetical protein J6S93_02660, partial [Paludibacteraceae bacterium]|nr:hypothetical protein [Paludibacteraceae bacterium]
GIVIEILAEFVGTFNFVFHIHQSFKVGSINSFREIFEFISSRLQSGGREQCEHCDRLTNSNMPKEIKKYRKSL